MIGFLKIFATINPVISEIYSVCRKIIPKKIVNDHHANRSKEHFLLLCGAKPQSITGSIGSQRGRDKQRSRG
jgi:hypothetical protein